MRNAANPPGVLRLNIGCGPTPTSGWVNYDNSWSVRLAKQPFMLRLLARTLFLDDSQRHLCDVARAEGIHPGNALKIGYADGTVDVIYSSHMLEHLDRTTARQFLAEAHRVLKPHGILRLAVPDLAQLVQRYNDDGDADALIASSLLSVEQPKTFPGKLRYLLLGSRHHAWMYDSTSLVAFVRQAGFESVHPLARGVTTIPDPGALDLLERADESIYVEAWKPATGGGADHTGGSGGTGY